SKPIYKGVILPYDTKNECFPAHKPRYRHPAGNLRSSKHRGKNSDDAWNDRKSIYGTLSEVDSEPRHQQ
ncbi:MAG: hypothetical protein ACK55Z_34445, partial [bacterium]